jgi:hypothetical protein
MLHVLLDIDETLLRYVKKKVWECIPNRADFTTIFYNDYVFMLRPNVQDFLNFIFSKFEVSIWTWGCAEYAKIVANILTNGNTHKFKDILSLEDCEIASMIHETGGKDLRYLWYDFNINYCSEDVSEKIEWRNSVIDIINEDRINKQKPLYSITPMKLFSEYTPRNTILIDDGHHNLVEPNKFNMILVNSFGSKTQDIPIFDSLDNEFDRITQILETVSDYHETFFDENKPVMTDIYNCLPLLEYQKNFINTLTLNSTL